MAFKDQVGVEEIGDCIKGYWDLVGDLSSFCSFCKENLVLLTNEESTSEVNFLGELDSNFVVEHTVWKVCFMMVVACVR